jgi:hypothetical protein
MGRLVCKSPLRSMLAFYLHHAAAHSSQAIACVYYIISSLGKILVALLDTGHVSGLFKDVAMRMHALLPTAMYAPLY